MLSIHCCPASQNYQARLLPNDNGEGWTLHKSLTLKAGPISEENQESAREIKKEASASERAETTSTELTQQQRPYTKHALTLLVLMLALLGHKARPGCSVLGGSVHS